MRSQSGMGLVQALLLAIVLACLGLVVAQMGQRLSIASKQMNTRNQAGLSKELVLNMVKHDEFVDRPYANGALSIRQCMARPGNGNCPKVMAAGFDLAAAVQPNAADAEWEDLSIQLPDGTTYNGKSDSSDGFKTDGKICHDYPSSGCPLHMSLHWGLACDPNLNTCENPLMFMGDLQVAPAVRVVNINPDRFKIRERLKTHMDFQKAACQTMGGTYDILGDLCECPNGGVITSGCKTFKEITNCSDGQILTYNAGTNTLECH